MDWNRIQREWERGNRQIAIELLRAMVSEMGYRQRSLADFEGER